jgi:hypothetical protein
LAMLLTFIAGLGAIVVAPVAVVIGWPATIMLDYSMAVARFFAGLDWATSYVTIGPLAVVAAYGVIAIACGYLRWASRSGIDAPSLL